MKQILIKLAALGLLFSVVSTYACDSCGCNHKASEHFRPGETSNAGKDNNQPQDAKRAPAFNEEGKEPRTGRIWLDEEHNSDVSEEDKKSSTSSRQVTICIRELYEF